jgi:hypothetical protein
MKSACLNRKAGRFDAGRQALAQLGDGFFHFAGQGHAVGGRLLLHRQDHRRLAL